MSELKTLGFHDLAIDRDKTYMREIVVDGERGQIELRKVSYADYKRLRLETPKPDPPGAQMPDGSTQYFYEDKGYLAQMEDWQTLVGLKRTLASVCMEIPPHPDHEGDDHVAAQVMMVAENWSDSLLASVMGAVADLHQEDRVVDPPDSFQSNGHARATDDGGAGQDA